MKEQNEGVAVALLRPCGGFRGTVLIIYCTVRAVDVCGSRRPKISIETIPDSRCYFESMQLTPRWKKYCYRYIDSGRDKSTALRATGSRSVIAYSTSSPHLLEKSLTTMQRKQRSFARTVFYI